MRLRPSRWVALLAASALFTGVACATDVPAPRRATHYGPFPSPLLDSPLIITGDFGEHRNNHFHAGLDIATGHRVGWPVHAPIDAELKRVRASGVGYGRSLYMESADGRLLVFGHLDAFAEPLASYVAAAQDSSGQYEQDLWPEAGRFRFKAGDIIAWTGQSGAGGPHLHVEVRNVDMAMNPLLTGFAINDTFPSRVTALTVVPLDDTSSVAGAARPARLALAAGTTPGLQAWGRLRLVVETWDVGLDGVGRMAPYRLRVASDGDFVEYRFDSVSWATDMPQSDYVFDKGRYTNEGKVAFVMAAPAGFRQSVVTTSAPLQQQAGVFVVDTKHPERLVTIEAVDVAGLTVKRQARITAVRPDSVRGRSATPEAGTWVEPTTERVFQIEGLAGLEIPKEALFEPERVRFERSPIKSGSGLTLIGEGVVVRPVTTPLRSNVTISLAAPPGDTACVGLYKDVGDGWEWMGRDRDKDGARFVGTSRRFGRFAVFRDAHAPTIRLTRPARRATKGAYSLWRLEARLGDGGSGIDARATYFEIDGRRVASEWDSEVATLRWRPLAAPASGQHRVRVIAADRCGNIARSDGSFVLE